MSDISINPAQGQPIGTPAEGGDGAQAKPATTTPTPETAAAAATADSVIVSAVAQTVSTGNASGKSALSESDASAQSYHLRQQLSGAPLSGTARQNQAILALLR